MKRTALFIAVILNLQFSISNLQAQTGLYKHFANRPGVKAYCVERYPLAEGDTACVTLLQVEDSATYKALRKEMKAMPWTPTKTRLDGTLSTPLIHKDLPERDPKRAKSDPKKSMEGFTIDGLEGDGDNYYYVCCPSDRLVYLAFLLHDGWDFVRVFRHLLITEF